MYPYGIAVEVLETDQNRHGDVTESVLGVINGCAVAPASSTEDTDRRAQVDMRCELYTPPTDVPLSPQFRVRFPDGNVWDIDGEPQRWANPYVAGQAGVVLRLKRVTG